MTLTLDGKQFWSHPFHFSVSFYILGYLIPFELWGVAFQGVVLISSAEA